MDSEEQKKLNEFRERASQQQRRYYARSPKTIGNLVSQLIAKRGYAATGGHELIEKVWAEAAGPFFASHSRIVGLNRGVLRVTVRSSAMLQEINFHQPRLLDAVQKALSESHVTSLRFRVGRLT